MIGSPALRFDRDTLALFADKQMVGPAFELIPRLLILLNDPDANCDQIADLIRIDPALTAEVLRVANSARHAGSAPIESLADAIARTGLREVTRSVIKLIASSALIAQACVGYQRIDLWRHSLATALAARLLSSRLVVEDPEIAFTAGILHDLGKSVFARAAGLGYVNLLEQCALTKQSVFAAERAAFATDHAEVAGHLLRHWNFPTPLVNGIVNHHTPERQDPASAVAAVVHIANTIAYRIGEGNGTPLYCAQPSPHALTRLRLNLPDLAPFEEETLKLVEAEHGRLW